MAALSTLRLERRLALVPPPPPKNPNLPPPLPATVPSMHRVMSRDPRAEIPSDPPPEQLNDREILVRMSNQVSQIYQTDVPEIKGQLGDVTGRVATLEGGFGSLERRIDRVATDVVKVTADVAAIKVSKGALGHVEIKVKTPTSLPPVSIPADEVKLPTGVYKAVAGDKQALEALIAAKSTEMANAAIAQHEKDMDAGTWRTVRSGGWKIALVAVGFVITAFLAALFASIAQQAHDQKAPLEQLEHH